MPAGEGIKTDEDDLLFGLREFQLQQRLFEKARGRLGLAATAGPGLALRYQSSGLPDATWSIDDSDDDGAAVVRSISGGIESPAGIIDRALDQHGIAVGYDQDGVPFSFDEAADSGALSIPNDNTWYTVIVEAELTEDAEGTVDLAPPSATVTGSDTRMTDYLDESVSGRGTIMIIEGSGSGNNDDYDITSIATDASMDVDPVPAAVESDLRWKPGAAFADIADPKRPILARRRAAFSVVARTRKPSAGQYVLADVKRNDAGTPKIEIIDRRHESAARRRDLIAGAVRPIVTETAGTLGVDERQVTGTEFDVCGVSHTDRGGWVVLIYNSISSRLVSYTYDPTDGTWSAGSTVPGGEPSGGDIVKLPRGHTFTHLVIGRSGELRGTTNNGTTWSSLGTIWSPGGGDAVEVGSICLTRYGRLIVTGHYTPSGGGASDASVRYIYSDDYGATWVTTAGAGTTIVAASLVGTALQSGASAAHRVRAMDDGRLLVLFEDSADAGPTLVFTTSDELPTPTSTSGTTDHLIVDALALDIVTTPGRGLYLLLADAADMHLAAYGDKGQGASAFVEELRRYQVQAKASVQAPKAHYNPITGEIGLAYGNPSTATTEFRPLSIEFVPR